MQYFLYLQYEDEVVDRFPSLVQEVMRRVLVAVVELELLDDVRVSEDPQQDLLRDQEGAEEAHLWAREEGERSKVSLCLKQNLRQEGE